MNPCELVSLLGLFQGCPSRTLPARRRGKPERRPSERRFFAARILSPLAMLAALGAHSMHAAAQDAAANFPMPYRVAQINTSPGSASVAGSRQDMAQDEVLPLKAFSPPFAAHPLNLAGIPLQEAGPPKTASNLSLKGKVQNDFLNAEWSVSPEQNLASKTNHGLHFPLLKQATIANVLLELKKRFGPESMMQSGNFHWFFDSQRFLATGDKSPSLIACNKMSRWSSICASTNASNFGVYIKL
jgi:hypothetical protein